MENNNNFENGFYGVAPQKPFTDKSSEVFADSQRFSSDESANQQEPTEVNEQNVQNVNAEAEQVQNTSFTNEPVCEEIPSVPVQGTSEVHDAQQNEYQRTPAYAQQRPNVENAWNNDYSHPQYSGNINYVQNGMPIQPNCF